MSKDEPVLKPDAQSSLDPSSELYILQEELEALYDVEACEIFCYQLSQDIVDHSLAVVQDRYYDEKCIPFTVNCVAEQMFTILDYVFMPRDYGEIGPAIDDSTWMADDEPPTIPCDSWSRGSVPIRPKAPSDPMSARSAISSSSKISSVRKLHNRELKPVDITKPKIQQSEKQNTSSPALLPPNGLLNPDQALGNTTNSAAGGRRSNLAGTTRKKEVVKLSPVEEDAMRRQQQDAEDRSKLEKLKQSLRGKDYAYDNNGEVILLNKLDASKLPTNSVKLKFAISDSPLNESGTPEQSPEPLSKKKKTQTSTSKDKKKVVNQFITETSPSYPMVDKLKPAQGVTFKDGKKVVKGAPIEIEKSMLKSTRQKALQQQQQQLDKTLDKNKNKPPEPAPVKKEEIKPVVPPVPTINVESQPERSEQPKKQVSLNLNRRQSEPVIEDNLEDLDKEEDSDEEPPKPLAPQAPAKIYNRNATKRPGELKNKTRTRNMPPKQNRQKSNAQIPPSPQKESEQEDGEEPEEHEPELVQTTQVGLTRRDLPSVATVENTDLHYAFLQATTK